MRYSNQDEEDSEELDIPNENTRNLSSVIPNQENDDSSSMSAYKTVPQSVQIVRPVDRNFIDISGNNKDILVNFTNEKKVKKIIKFSPEGKFSSPLVKRKYGDDLNIGRDINEFNIESVSEF